MGPAERSTPSGIIVGVEARGEHRDDHDEHDQHGHGQEEVPPRGQHPVDPPPAIARKHPESGTEDHRDGGGESGGQERRAPAIEDAAERVAAELVGPEEVVQPRTGEHGVEVVRIGRVRRQPGRQRAGPDDPDHEDQRDERDRPPGDATEERPRPTRTAVGSARGDAPRLGASTSAPGVLTRGPAPGGSARRRTGRRGG